MLTSSSDSVSFFSGLLLLDLLPPVPDFLLFGPVLPDLLPSVTGDFLRLLDLLRLRLSFLVGLALSSLSLLLSLLLLLLLPLLLLLLLLMDSLLDLVLFLVSDSSYLSDSFLSSNVPSPLVDLGLLSLFFLESSSSSFLVLLKGLRPRYDPDPLTESR